MKIKNTEQILDKFVKYANVRQKEKLSYGMIDLSMFSAMRGISLTPNRRLDKLLKEQPDISEDDLTQAKPLALQQALRETLKAIMEKRAVDVTLSSRIETTIQDNGTIMLSLNVSDDDGDDYIVAKVMAQLMLFSGVKAVRKCPGCGDYFLIKKSMIQKTCSNKCRQRVYQAGLTPPEKRHQRMRRSEIYQKNKIKKS